MNSNKQFLYRLNLEAELESLYTDNKNLQNILDKVGKHYLLPNFNIEIKKQLNLGNIAFYILDFPDLSIDKETSSKMQLINSYLSLCIENNKYCDCKIFLSFVRDILKIQDVPTGRIYASNYYKSLDNINNFNEQQKIDLFLNNIKNININKDYICNDIIELVVISLFEIFSKGYLVKRCRNCHRYFYNKTNNKYCPYSSPQNNEKSCYDYSTNALYLEKRENDPIRKKYNSISNMLRSRYRYHENQNDWQILYRFSDDYKNKMTKLNLGKISVEDVINFLNFSELNFKKTYKERRKNNGSSRNNKK